jgi:hypothetical protein
VAKKLVGITESPAVFRSYGNYGLEDFRPITHGPATKNPIQEVGRATAAAPTYFKPIEIDGDQYSDGGMGYNNPAEEAYAEILHKEGHINNRRQSIPIHLFLSIGTGGDDANEQPEESAQGTPEPFTNGNKKKKRKKSGFLRHLQNLSDRMQGEVVEAKRVDRNMRFKSKTEDWHYIRWTGGKDLAKLKLDRWKPPKSGEAGTQLDIETWMRNYMSNPKRRNEVKEIARILVDIRRKRIRWDDGDRWQRYTYCSHFVCPLCRKKDYNMAGTKETLRRHLETDHPGKPQNHSDWVRAPPKVDGGPW